MLPQFQQRRSQVMLDLYAMQVHRHFNFSDHIRSMEHSPPVLHVQNLDREDIRGVLQFFFREKKRRRLFQIGAPPFHHRRDSSQFLDTQRMKDASHVQIRMSFVKIPPCRRPEQNHAFEVCGRKFLQPSHQLRQFHFRGEHFSTIPFLQPTSFLKRLRLRCCRRQILRTLRHLPPPPPPPTPPPPPLPPGSPTSPAPKPSSAPASAGSAPGTIHQHSQQKPETAASASSSPSARNQAPDHHNKHNQGEDKPESANSAVISANSSQAHRRLPAERYARIGGNIAGNLPGTGFGCFPVVALAQVGHHRAPCVPGTRIINHRLQPVSYFDAVLALVGSDQQ